MATELFARSLTYLQIFIGFNMEGRLRVLSGLLFLFLAEKVSVAFVKSEPVPD